MCKSVNWVKICPSAGFWLFEAKMDAGCGCEGRFLG